MSNRNSALGFVDDYKRVTRQRTRTKLNMRRAIEDLFDQNAASMGDDYVQNPLALHVPTTMNGNANILRLLGDGALCVMEGDFEQTNQRLDALETRVDTIETQLEDAVVPSGGTS